MKVTTVTAPPKEFEIPLSLQAAASLIERRKGKDPDDVLDAVVASAGDITAAAEKVKDTVSKILANEMAMPIKRTADAKNAAHKIFGNVAPKLDATRRRTQAAIATLEASSLPPAPKDAMQALYAQECRQALARMPEAERAKTVQQAISDGDDALVSAAILGSATLVGLGRSEQAALADSWRRHRHGPTIERIERLRGALNEFDRLCGLLSGWSFGLLADKNAAVAAAEKSAELARAAMAEVA